MPRKRNLLKLAKMETLLKQAIETGVVIEFTYDGERRIVEPFTLGILKTTGNLVLCGYRVGGFSKSGNTPPWRNYIVAGMSDLILTAIPAEPFREGYNPPDARMSSIIATR